MPSQTTGASAGFRHARSVGQIAALFRQPLLRKVARRALLSVPLVFVVSVLTFVLVWATPSDIAETALGVQASPEAYEKFRHDFGLDLPLHEQYWRWLRHALAGDLGTSVLSDQSIAATILHRFPVTLSLMGGALLVTLVIGVSLGVFSAVRGGVVGRLVDALSLVGFALPGFWFAAVLVSLFAVSFGLLPAIGYVPFGESPGDWLRSLVLPVAALSLHSVGVMARQTREAMMDVLASEHIRIAHANGMPRSRLFFRFALKNVSLRIVTLVGLQAVGLLVGTVLIEQVFALPGLGSILVSATMSKDLPVVQGITIFFTVIIVVINLVVDIAYTVLDPRVRTS